MEERGSAGARGGGGGGAVGGVRPDFCKPSPVFPTQFQFFPLKCSPLSS